MKHECQIAVVGAGVTGLCAGFYARRAAGDDAVLVLEAGEKAGGQTQTDLAENYICDWGPNGFLDREPLTLQWAEDLGIAHHLTRCNADAAHRFILKDNRLHEVVGPPKFLLSPLLSLGGRLRLCCEPLIPPKRDDTPETIWDFAARRIGREAADLMVTPMVSGVFGGDAKEACLQYCFPRMAGFERDYGGLVKALIAIKRKDKGATPTGPRGTLTSFAKGIGFLPQVAAQALGPSLKTSTRVERVVHEDGVFRLHTGADDCIEARNVIMAVPAHAAARLVAGLDAGLTRALASIPYADLAVVCAGYPREQIRHGLDGFGFLVPRNQNKRLLGCLWTSSIFPGRAPGGHVHLRCMFGGASDPEAIHLSDDELLDCLRREVHPILGIGTDPDFLRVYRHGPGIPQYLCHHGTVLEAIEDAETRYRGLVFAGNAYRGVALNDCVVSARSALGRIPLGAA